MEPGTRNSKFSQYCQALLLLTSGHKGPPLPPGPRRRPALLSARKSWHKVQTKVDRHVQQILSISRRAIAMTKEELYNDFNDYFGNPDGATQATVDDEACSFCDEIHISSTSEDIQEGDLGSLFHQPCSGCSAQDPSLCARCQHFRLRHHLLCDEDRDYEICIALDHLLENLRQGSSPSCAMCSFFVEAARQEIESQIPHCNMQKCTDFYLECRTQLLSEPELTQTEICPSPWALVLLVYFDDRSSQIITLAGFDFQSQRLASIDSPSAGTVQLQHESLQKRAIPHVGQTINWEVMKNLMETCCASHQNCHMTEVELPIGFRLIDVENRCLVKASNTDVGYFALSYVWGKACGVSGPKQTVATLTKSSLNDLQQEKSLLPSVLPKTVEDALQACVALGSKYLWVDRLCIIQDDNEDKNVQIEAMGTIFASAKLVLIAADAENMHSGISGISKPRRHASQAVVNSSGTGLQRVLTRMELSTKGTPWWFSRAWTYQEAILAKRKVWFTPVQAHLECQSGIFTEDLWGSYAVTGTTAVRQVHPPGLVTSEAFKRHLLEYTELSLSYQSDIYNALTGIANSLYGEGSLIYGLPQKDFDELLLWETTDPEPRSADGVVLPSWSWASINAPVSLDSQLFCGSLVKWFACVKHGGKTSTVPIRADNEPWTWTERANYEYFLEGTHGGSSPHLYMGIACIQGCIQTPLPKCLLGSSSQTIMELEISAQSLWPTYEAYCHHLYAQSEELTQAKMQMLEPGTLLGRAQIATLRYTRHIEHENCRDFEPKFDFEMYGDDDRPIGAWTGVEPQSVLQEGRIKAIALSVLNHGSFYLYNSILWCLSRSFPKLCAFESKYDERFRDVGTEVLRDPSENLTFFDCEGKALLPPPMLYVMVVQEDGSFYRRIGLGQVFLSRWLQAGPRFETVLLR